MKTYRVDFLPLRSGREVTQGQSLWEAAQGVYANQIGFCGGAGKCGRCKIRVLSGRLSPLTAVEKADLTERDTEHGIRLACQACPDSDVTAYILPESLNPVPKTHAEGTLNPVDFDPPVRAFELLLPPPTLSKPTADDDAVTESLGNLHGVEVASFDQEVRRSLSLDLRAMNWQVKAFMRSSELIGLGKRNDAPLGLAVDLGTTKIAGYLVDLESGAHLASKAMVNPQIRHGEDILTRLSFAQQGATEAESLQRLAVDGINALAADLSSQAGVGSERIMECVVVGNTAMHHLLLHLPVRYLTESPYVPSSRQAIDMKSRDLGLLFSKGSFVHLLPNIAGFIGGDHVAAILSARLGDEPSSILLIDIGTNTEICLAHNGKMVSCSCASGPAFEGRHIKCGMRAAAGAIERVVINEQGTHYQTIDHSAPEGLCGSGILDGIAQLSLMGVIDETGMIQPDHPRVRRNSSGQKEYVLIGEEEREGLEPIVITQKDIREIQLAKAAIRSGTRLLTDAMGCVEEEIDQVVIAGAFGSFLHIPSGIAIGMFPSLPLKKYRQVGNAAGAGAVWALISESLRCKSQLISRKVDYLELAASPDFGEIFIESINILQS